MPTAAVTSGSQYWVLDDAGYKPSHGADRFENGRVFLPVDAPWLDDYIVEAHRLSECNDQVHSATQPLDHMREDMYGRPPQLAKIDCDRPLRPYSSCDAR
jgi:hypothetical protein